LRKSEPIFINKEEKDEEGSVVVGFCGVYGVVREWLQTKSHERSVSQRGTRWSMGVSLWDKRTGPQRGKLQPYDEFAD